ncbi:MAG: hypothetical protein FWD80_06755 [Propionibacteriaceae bacterium]|nr:hypothetical protein [Propionibacteriaceae bacterium]
MEIGIDVGGTHTRIVVADKGSPIGEFSTLTAAWRRGTLFSDEQNAARLLALVPSDAVGRADVPLVAGTHGCDTKAQCDMLATWLGRIHPGPIRVVNDSELFGPALGLTAAIAVVSGTGSIVVGRDGDGELVKVGGYGWILGDPGAAPSLVRESVVAIMQADDEGAMPGALARALMAHYGSSDAVGLGYDFTADAGMTNWGALAPLVFDAADAGDQIAIRVIEADGRQLAQDVQTLRAKDVVSFDVVASGGVITSQPRLERAFTNALQVLDPSMRVHILRGAPVDGALTLAAELGRGQV